METGRHPGGVRNRSGGLAMRRYCAMISWLALGIWLYGMQAPAAVTSDIPSAKFTADDFRMQREAQDSVLASTDIGTTRSWENPATGNSGSIKLLRSFQSSDGRECKRIQITNQAGPSKAVSTMNMCRNGAGPWRIDSTAHT
jgi:surface antigen